MNFLSLIESKRDGQALSAAQILALVQAITTGRVPDYQLSAFLMAAYFRGLDAEETRALTLAMRDSGTRLTWPDDPRPVVDKHSTGGVGDKISLALAPLLACLGFRVPMISGRGLGITGGTLDKLESIPGFRTALPAPRIREIVQEVGCVICGQTADMVPADRVLYGLRDVTGTVPSIPLIVASILSKKLAEGISALVLDVKFGAAAFMPSIEQARVLAEAMTNLGNECGVHTRALVTKMDAPIGTAAGNWLEVRETVELLTEPGRAPKDLYELVRACAAALLVQTKKAANIEAAENQVEQCLAGGQPRQKWDEMLVAQGADLGELAEKLARGSEAPVIEVLRADKEGYVTSCDARLLGEMIRELGGGRLVHNAVIDPVVGVDCICKPGTPVSTGSVLARIHAQTADQARAAAARLLPAWRIAPEPPAMVSASPVAEMVLSGSAENASENIDGAVWSPLAVRQGAGK